MNLKGCCDRCGHIGDQKILNFINTHGHRED